MLRTILLLGSLLFLTYDLAAQNGEARRQITKIIQSSKAKIGVSVLGLEDRDTLAFDGKGHYPMQSVYKFPLAVAVLHEVDRGTLSLDMKIRIRKEDLLPETWSPLRDKYPQGGVDVPLSEILRYTVSLSDNNGCDIMFRMLGGPAKVEAYIRSIGITGMAFAATEEEMHANPKTQFSNWCEPDAMVKLLDMFNGGRILSESSRKFLWDVMTETSTGPNRIKGLLPPGTVVAHKTGSSGKNRKGITYAVNDVGIITLPNGKHVAIVAYVSNSRDDNDTLENIIARISKVVWDYFSSKKCRSLQFHVQTYRSEIDRTAIGIVGRIGDMLPVDRHRGPFHDA